MPGKARTVEEYLNELPEDRRAAISAVRAVILKNMDKNIEEGIQYGQIGYYIPHRFFPAGYHCDPKQPLPFAGLASQKSHMSLHLMCIYIEGDEAGFQEAWLKTGKKLDMGKACVRFKKIEDVALDVIADLFKRTTAKAFIEKYQAAFPRTVTDKKARAAAKKKVSKSPSKSSKSDPPLKSGTSPRKAARKKTT